MSLNRKVCDVNLLRWLIGGVLADRGRVENMEPQEREDHETLCDAAVEELREIARAEGVR